MPVLLKREAVYLWYYFTVQFEQIAGYYALGILLGSVISVFGKTKIHALLTVIQGKKLGVLGLVPASLIGIASPLCMYGTIPIAASFSEKGIEDDWLAAFMMSSILLNPQLLFYSAALGTTALVVRFASCFLCGIVAGLCVRYLCKGKSFFNFAGFRAPTNQQPRRKQGMLFSRRIGLAFHPPFSSQGAGYETFAANHDTDPNPVLRLMKNIGRNIKTTGVYFLVGILLSAIFQRYVPEDAMAALFGGNRGFGLLMAATVGVPLYMCGGGTIPLLMTWLQSGMRMGSVAAFMITGPATKITNLGAVKIVLGVKNFVLYLVFVMLSALLSGFLVEYVLI
ncbi:MAG: permease [Spirochaetaceae bacterium]|jgi:uncharacterized membrane protein YraQ (UPF0718 family)|nr:permease [Spirochaetaceae bacterium]